MTTPPRGDEHTRAIRRYVAWQAGLIDEEQVRASRAHIEACDDCRQQAEMLDVDVSDPHEGGHLPADLLARWPAASAHLHGLERELVESHIGHCAECRAGLEFLGHVVALSAEAVSSPARSPGLAGPANPARVIRLTPRRLNLREWMLTGWGGLATAACAALLVAGHPAFMKSAEELAQVATNQVQTSPEPPNAATRTSPPPAKSPGIAPGETVRPPSPQPGAPASATVPSELLAANNTEPPGGASQAEVLLAAQIVLGDNASSRGVGDAHPGPAGAPSESRHVIEDDQRALQIVHPEGLGLGVPAAARVTITIVLPSGREMTVHCQAGNLDAQPTIVTFPASRAETGEYVVRYVFEDPSHRSHNAVERFRVEHAPH